MTTDGSSVRPGLGGARQRMGVRAQPRAATREAVLDSAVQCLVDWGYAGTTTARIADLSGVARSVQAYYFSGRDELLIEAVKHLEISLTGEFRAAAAAAADAPHARPALLDALWKLHSGPLFIALSELWIAARTNPALRPFLAQLNTSVTATLEPAWGADAPRVLAAVRGLAMLRHLDAATSVERAWEQLRMQLLEPAR